LVNINTHYPMSKKNKWTLVPFILFAALILAGLYFLTLHKPSPPPEPIRAIPLNASVIVKVNNLRSLFEKLTTHNAIWNELRTIPDFGRIDRQLHFLDSLFKNVPEAEQILKNPPSFISAHFTGKDKVSLMHVFQLPPHYPERKIADLLAGLVVNAGTVSTRKYENTVIHEVALLNESTVKNFSFAVYRDILIVSFSAILLEDAIRQFSAEETILSQRGFREIYATAGKNVDANVFINFQHFPKSLSAAVRPDFKAEVRSVRSFAGWAEMDVNLLSDMLLLNGFVNPPDSVSSMVTLLLSQAPQRITADEFLPGSVASFFTLSLSDPNRYFSDYQTYLRDQGLFTSYQNTLASLNNTYGTDLPNELIEIMDNEITQAFDPGNQEGSPGRSYFLMRIKSNTQAEEKMNSIMARIAAVESKPVASYTTLYRLDNELTYKIYFLPVRKFTAKIFGNLFSALDEHYYAIMGNYLVFSSSVESIQSLIHDIVLNKTLLNDQAFQEFKNSLSPRSNMYFYCNLSKAQSVYAPYLTDAIRQPWIEFQTVFQKVQIMGFQLYSNNKMLYNNFLLKFLSAYSNQTQTVWESKLDTLVDLKPVFVINHETRQNEVFVQDLKNNIYLINQVGRILWKVQLPEPINSEIFQIDYFRNGKLQLLFSTRNTLYLIDRNGNFVEKYPVKLRSPSTCGLAVFDYDNNRDYRLFIACEDRHVYAYTKEGNLIPGWGFDRSESEVIQPVEHFRIGNKDFIVFGDRFRTYILDRKGNVRVDVETYFPKSAQNNYLLNVPRDGSGPGVVTTDTTGRIYFIGFNGKTTTLEPAGKFTSAHFFDYKDLNGDGKPELIYLDGRSLTVYNKDLSRLFDYDFDSPILSRPLFYQFSASDRKLGVVSRSENRIYLINNTGDLYAGFPLQGNTPFSIGNFGDSLSKFNLVVGSGDNFLYNYRVK
jgi:hypothetical protein